MKRLRLYTDKDMEEKWLNEMCQKGWAMTKFYIGVYTFEPCEPGKYIYRVDMPGEIGKNNMRGANKEQYIEFIEETGAEHVCNWFWWTIFRKEASKGTFELYTDPESQIGLYQRIRKLFIWVGLVELLCGINNTVIFFKSSIKDYVDLIALVVIYLCIMVFLTGIIKTSRKINELREKCLLTK